MEQVHQIQERLFSIDPTTFERLCGFFLYNHSEYLVPPVPSGKAIAKNRPAKGNPDAYYYDGNQYHFQVCTAQDGRRNKGALVKKIVTDIKKALDVNETSIAPSEICVIHVCLASDISAAEDQKIRSAFSEYSDLIKIWNGYQISSLIYSYYPHLASEYLGISIGRKVILSLQEYLLKIGSAPESHLVNPYVSPENFDFAKDKLQKNKILLITGSSGTGKTRLAIELLKNYSIAYPQTRAYCIRSNAAPSSEAIAIELSPGSNCLLIDDAGRETANLIRIIQHWQANDKYIDKLILTTRDYTLNNLKHVLTELSEPFEVLEMDVSSKSFIESIVIEQGIVEHNAIQKIVAIAKGRARMAVMGAQALLSGTPAANLDAEEIYTGFFASIIRDKPELNDITAQNILGIIYFFKYIDFDDPKSVEDRLGRFHLNELEVKKIALNLKNSEFLDEMENIYRVGDQEIGFYHFFKVFIKDCSLPIRNLLTKNELKYIHQLKETVGQCFKIFDQSPSLVKVRALLEETYETLTDDDARFDFLEIFGAEFPDLAYELTCAKVNSLPRRNESNIFVVNDFTQHVMMWDRSKVSRYVRLAISAGGISIGPYLEQYMELVRRSPNLFDDYLHFIYDDLAWTEKDRLTGYSRQQIMLAILSNHASNNDSLALVTIRALGLHWITSAYPEACAHIATANGFHTIQDSSHVPIRVTIWKLLIPQIGKEIDPYKFLLEYLEKFDWGEVHYHSVDSEYLQYIISRFLNPAVLSHGILVNNLSKRITSSIKEDKWFAANRKIFLSDDVLLGEALSFRLERKYRRRGGYETQQQYEERLLKSVTPFFIEARLSESFIRLYRLATIIVPEQKDGFENSFVYNRLLGLLERISSLSAEDYLLSVKYIIQDKNSIYFLFRQSAIQKLFASDPTKALALHQLLVSSDYKAKDITLLNFYTAIPVNLLQEEHATGFRNLFERRTDELCLDIQELRKFEKFIPNLSEFIVESSIIRQAEGARQIRIVYQQETGFFEELCQIRPDLAEGLYKMLVSGSLFHDKDGTMLSRLTQIRPKFISELIAARFNREIRIERGVGIGTFLFDGSIPGSEEIVHELLDLYVEKQFPSEEFADLIFGSVIKNSDEYKVALSILRSYGLKNISDHSRIRKLFRVIAKQFNEHWLDTIEVMLYHNLNPTWLSSFNFSQSSMYAGGTIISDVHKKRYESILTRILHSDFKIQNPIQFQLCCSELHKIIRVKKESARNERRREFMSSTW